MARRGVVARRRGGYRPRSLGMGGGVRGLVFASLEVLGAGGGGVHRGEGKCRSGGRVLYVSGKTTKWVLWKMDGDLMRDIQDERFLGLGVVGVRKEGSRFGLECLWGWAIGLQHYTSVYITYCN